MLIEKQKGRRDGNSGYSRVFNNEELGVLLSKVQAAVISNGSELERMILARTLNIASLDQFLEQVNCGTQPYGSYVCTKPVTKKCRLLKQFDKIIEPDLLIFVLTERQKKCVVLELKDGDTFDTRKVIGEKEHLMYFRNTFGSQIPFATEYRICRFNQDNKKDILVGLKHAFTEDEIFTGRELCALLQIDFEEIINTRKKTAEPIPSFSAVPAHHEIPAEESEKLIAKNFS